MQRMFNRMKAEIETQKEEIARLRRREAWLVESLSMCPPDYVPAGRCIAYVECRECRLAWLDRKEAEWQAEQEKEATE